MKKYAVAIITAAALSAPAITATAAPLYVSVSGGLSLMDNSNAEITGTSTSIKDAVEYKRGYALEAALGEDKGMYRGELAVGYQSNDVDQILGSDMDAIESATEDILNQWGISDNIDDLKIKASALTVMYNLYADYNMSSLITPYVMGGVGAAFMGMDVSFRDNGVRYEQSYDKTAFAWQLGAGLGIKVMNNVTIDLGYRYFRAGDIDFGSDAKLSFGGSKILLGVRYNL